MSAELNVVLTPYMEITYNPISVREVKETINICSNIECKQHINKKVYKCNFCPVCGAAVEPYIKVSNVNDVVDIDELMHEAGKEDLFFHHNDLDVYLPNHLKEHRTDIDDDNVHEIGEYSAKNAISALYNDPLYRKFLISLDEKCVTYEIKYGLITYYW